VSSWPASVITTTVERVGLATFSRARDAASILTRRFGSDQHGRNGRVCRECGSGAARPQIVELVYGTSGAGRAGVGGLGRRHHRPGAGRSRLHLMITPVRRCHGAVQVIWLVALVPTAIFATAKWGLVGMAGGRRGGLPRRASRARLGLWRPACTFPPAARTGDAAAGDCGGRCRAVGHRVGAHHSLLYWSPAC